MASFPTSVFSPSARSNGQVIDASHVNDLQGEVTAIEDGFRNATAPLNSSGSTLASLSVTGNSTVAALTAGASTLASLSVTGASTFGAMTLGASTLASLNVTGASTLTGHVTLGGSLSAGASTFGNVTMTGSLQVSGNSTVSALSVSGASTFAIRPVEPPPDAVMANLADPLQFAGNSTTAIGWTNAAIKTNSSLHSTATNPERFTPQSTGVYVYAVMAEFRTAFAAGSTANAFLELMDSSGTRLSGMTVGAAGDAPAMLHVTAMKRVDVVDGNQWVRTTARYRTGSTNALSTESRAMFWKL